MTGGTGIEPPPFPEKNVVIASKPSFQVGHVMRSGECAMQKARRAVRPGFFQITHFALSHGSLSNGISEVFAPQKSALFPDGER